MRALTILLSFGALSSNAFAQPAAFRITDMDLRDPHVYVVQSFACRDVTDAVTGFSFNGTLQTTIQSNGNDDGYLDVSTVIVFDDLDPSAPGGTLTFVNALCLAPLEGTSCTPSELVPSVVSYSNGSAGVCLETIPGTTYPPYTPEVTSPTAQCFVTQAFNGLLPLFDGVPVMLHDIQVSATYDGSGNLVNGLIRGFLTETDANNTILPNSFPFYGSIPFSYLLPGGNPFLHLSNCASHSDMDAHGSWGWWLYFNFSAQPVPYGSATDIGAPPLRGVSLQPAVPNPFNPSTTLRYSIDEDAFVQLFVFDAQGRYVAALVNEHQTVGDHEARWNGTMSTGSTASSGVYFVRLAAGGKTDTRKIVLLK